MGDDRLPSSFDSDPDFFQENSWAKLSRRLKEEPLIPLGCAATCYALWRAYRSMKVGDSAEVNRMFRARIYAQAFTLVAVVAGGMYYKTERMQRKELEKAMEEKKQQAKRDAWLKELEVRDQEDKGWKERHAMVEKAAKEAELKRPGSEQVETKKEEDEEATGENGDAKQGSGVLDAVKDMVQGKK